MIKIASHEDFSIFLLRKSLECFFLAVSHFGAQKFASETFVQTLKSEALNVCANIAAANCAPEQIGKH